MIVAINHRRRDLKPRSIWRPDKTLFLLCGATRVFGKIPGQQLLDAIDGIFGNARSASQSSTSDSSKSDSSNSSSPGAGQTAKGDAWGQIFAQQESPNDPNGDNKSPISGSVTALSNDLPASTYPQGLQAFDAQLNQSDIPYNPLTTNSNSLHDECTPVHRGANATGTGMGTGSGYKLECGSRSPVADTPKAPNLLGHGKLCRTAVALRLEER